MSEQELQRELDLPRGRGRVCNDPTRGAVLGAEEMISFGYAKLGD